MALPQKFDSSNLTDEQQNILAAFFNKRLVFNTYLTKYNKPLFTCPGCGYPTLPERGGYDICMVCGWEDDLQDDDQADEVWGGPNYTLSLTENRLQIGQQLKDLADSTGGGINDDPVAVLKILARYDRRIEELVNDLVANPEKEDASFIQYQQAGRNLLAELVKS